MPKLTLAEAEARRRLLRVSDYWIDLDLSRGSQQFASTTTVGFHCRTPGAQTFIELGPADVVRAVLNGRCLPSSARQDNRILLTDLEADNELLVEALIGYSTTAEGGYRFVDPADSAVYFGAYCGVDVAQRVFACFDQPDLKARLRVSARAPEGWTVVGNGRLTRSQDGR